MTDQEAKHNEKVARLLRELLEQSAIGSIASHLSLTQEALSKLYDHVATLELRIYDLERSMRRKGM